MKKISWPISAKLSRDTGVVHLSSALPVLLRKNKWKCGCKRGRIVLAVSSDRVEHMIFEELVMRKAQFLVH